MIHEVIHLGLLWRHSRSSRSHRSSFFPFTADDAYIVARYAVNARDLGEWTFNRGEQISAMTSPLHGVLLVGLSFLAADPLPLYKTLAIVLVTASFLWLLVRYGVQRREAAPLAAGLVAPSFILWMAAGLETPLLAAIVTAMSVISYEQPAGRRSLFALAFSPARRCHALRRGCSRPGIPRRSREDVPKKVDASSRVALAAVLIAAVAHGAVAPLFVERVRRRSAQHRSTSRLPVAPSTLSLSMLDIWPSISRSAASPCWCLYVAARLVSSGQPSSFSQRSASAMGTPLGIAAGAYLRRSMATVHMMFAFRHFMPYLAATALALALLARRGVTGWTSPACRVLRCVEPIAAVMILTVHGLHAEALFHRSLQGLGTQGEYAAQGMAGYARDFIPAMRHNAEDVRAHWDSLNIGRPPRIWTFAAGALPYTYREAYIFEELVSFRYRCPPHAREGRPDSRRWRAHADYIHASHGMVRRPFTVSVRGGHVQVISKQPINSMGAMRCWWLLQRDAATERAAGHIASPACAPRQTAIDADPRCLLTEGRCNRERRWKPTCALPARAQRESRSRSISARRVFQ